MYGVSGNLSSDRKVPAATAAVAVPVLNAARRRLKLGPGREALLNSARCARVPCTIVTAIGWCTATYAAKHTVDSPLVRAPVACAQAVASVATAPGVATVRTREMSARAAHVASQHMQVQVGRQDLIRARAHPI